MIALRRFPYVLALGAFCLVACRSHAPVDANNDEKVGHTTTTSADYNGASPEQPALTVHPEEAAEQDRERAHQSMAARQANSMSMAPADEPATMNENRIPMSLPAGGVLIGSEYPRPPATRPDLNDMGLHDPPTNEPATRANDTRGARDGGAPPPAPTPKPKQQQTNNSKRVMP